MILHRVYFVVVGGVCFVQDFVIYIYIYAPYGTSSAWQEKKKQQVDEVIKC